MLPGAGVVLFKPGAPLGTGCEVDGVVGLILHYDPRISKGHGLLVRAHCTLAARFTLNRAQVGVVDLQRGARLPGQFVAQAHAPRHARLEYLASHRAHQR